jgi:hypothetical protein
MGATNRSGGVRVRGGHEHALGRYAGVLTDELPGGIEHGAIHQARIHHSQRQTRTAFLQDKRAHK